MKFQNNIPKNLKIILDKIANDISYDKFILYGGSALDLLLYNQLKVKDLDIAIESKDKNLQDQIINSLNEQGYKVLKENRVYYINIYTEVNLIYAANDELTLDIAFIDSFGGIGQFNIESIYWKYPEGLIIDKYEAIAGIVNKKVFPIRDLCQENPYLLARRYLKLCAKYQISIDETLLLKIKALFDEWNPPENHFHLVESKTSALAGLLSTFSNYQIDLAFVKKIYESQLGETIFPLFNKFIEHIGINEFVSLCNSSINRSDLIRKIEEKLPVKKRRQFFESIKFIYSRDWETA